jgi:Rrf2 family iron-sulfur cluster assembly transcriptional regulator
MKLQQATMCGLYAVIELSSHADRQISAGEIATKYGISISHLAKVLRVLVRAGLIESTRGVGGGYRFTGNPKRVTLLDIIQLFENVGRDAEKDLPTDLQEGHALHTVLHEIDETAVATLRSISLTTLLKIMEKQQRGVVSHHVVVRGAATVGRQSPS